MFSAISSRERNEPWASRPPFRNDLLKLIYNATAIANLADNAASAPLTNIYVALHSADPGAGGHADHQRTVSYTNYARQAVARTTGGWTVTTNSVSPVANIVFPASGSSDADRNALFDRCGGERGDQDSPLRHRDAEHRREHDGVANADDWLRHHRELRR